MLALTNTENLTGVRISGDYWDFEELNLAIEKLIQALPETNDHLHNARTKLLKLCSNLKMTKRGESNIETTFNGINTKIRSSFDVDFPLENIYFSTEEFWPEILFLTSCLNNFLEEAYKSDQQLSLQPHVLVIRKLQSNVFRCLSLVAPSSEKHHLEALFFQLKSNLNNYAIQYIDFLNMNYLSLNRQERLEKLPFILQKIHQEDNEYISFKHRLQQIAKEANLPIHMIELELDYPPTILW